MKQPGRRREMRTWRQLLNMAGGDERGEEQKTREREWDREEVMDGEERERDNGVDGGAGGRLERRRGQETKPGRTEKKDINYTHVD